MALVRNTPYVSIWTSLITVEIEKWNDEKHITSNSYEERKRINIKPKHTWSGDIFQTRAFNARRKSFHLEAFMFMEKFVIKREDIRTHRYSGRKLKTTGVNFTHQLQVDLIPDFLWSSEGILHDESSFSRMKWEDLRPLLFEEKTQLATRLDGFLNKYLFVSP